MKLLMIGLIISLGLFARNTMDQFNNSMIQNIDTVIKNNPEKYETKSIGRKPASVKPVVEDTEILEEENSDYINKRDKQAIGHPHW